jgi:hypothetical protein
MQVAFFTLAGASVTIRYVQHTMAQSGSMTTTGFEKLLLDTANTYQTSYDSCWPIWGDYHYAIDSQVHEAARMHRPHAHELLIPTRLSPDRSITTISPSPPRPAASATPIALLAARALAHRTLTSSSPLACGSRLTATRRVFPPPRVASRRTTVTPSVPLNGRGARRAAGTPKEPACLIESCLAAPNAK